MGSFGTNALSIDLDGNAVNDLNFGVRWQSIFGTAGPTFLNLNSAFVQAAAGNAALLTAGGQVANLASGVQIGPAAAFTPNGNGGYLRAVTSSFVGSDPTQFNTAGNFGLGVVGFRFQQGRRITLGIGGRF